MATQSFLVCLIKATRRIFPFLSSAPRRKGVFSKVHNMAGAWDFFTHLMLFSDDLQRHVLIELYPTVSSGNREGALGSLRGQRGSGLLYKHGVNHGQG